MQVQFKQRFFGLKEKEREKTCHWFHFDGSHNVLHRKLAPVFTFELAGREKAKLWIKLDTVLGLVLVACARVSPSKGLSGSIKA